MIHLLDPCNEPFFHIKYMVDSKILTPDLKKSNIFTFEKPLFKRHIEAVYVYLSPLRWVLSVYKGQSTPKRHFNMLCKVFSDTVADF